MVEGLPKTVKSYVETKVFWAAFIGLRPKAMILPTFIKGFRLVPLGSYPWVLGFF